MCAPKILLPLLLLFAGCKSDSTPAENNAGSGSPEMANLLRQNDSLRSALAALKGEMSAGNPALANKQAAATLLRYELPTHPVELGDYLEKQQPKLLPPDGTTLGGTLHIETALPLEGNHVFVTGSDGHNYRYWLLQYEAPAGKAMQWQRIWTSKPL